jgi:hypothetical protein
MPRKTLLLITALVIVTIILFVIALRTTRQSSQQQQPQPSAIQQPQPTSAAHSVLTLSPNPVTVVTGQQGSIAVDINTSDNQVTAVQLEIGYDPHVVSNVKVTPGPLFQNAAVLINKNDVTSGRMTYAFGITPNHPTVNGTGTVATITFTAVGKAGQQSQFALLPTTLVTARGIPQSVLQSASGTLINIKAATAQPTAQTVTGAAPQTTTQVTVAPTAVRPTAL